MTQSIAATRLADPPMTPDDKEWYANGFEAATRGEPAVAPLAVGATVAQAEAWLRGHEQALREDAAPSMRVPMTQRFWETQREVASDAWVRKLSMQQERTERDVAARERLAEAAERIAAALERLAQR